MSDQTRFESLHDDLLQCMLHMHIRGVLDVKREMVALTKMGFEPEGIHAKGCPACDWFREAKALGPDSEGS